MLRNKLMSWLVMVTAGLAATLFLGLSLWLEVNKQVEAQLVAPGVEVGVEQPVLFADLREELPTTGRFLPNSWAYFLDAGGDRAGLWLTRGTEARYQRLLDLADERMGAARELMERGEGREGVGAMVKGVYYWESARLLGVSEQGMGMEVGRRRRLEERGLVYLRLLRLAHKQLNEEARMGIERMIETMTLGLNQAEGWVRG